MQRLHLLRSGLALVVGVAVTRNVPAATVAYWEFDTFADGSQDGRALHMCGQSTHLHKALVEDLRISSFNLFGYVVDPEVAARNLVGRMYLTGNINPMLMLTGPKSQVKQAALDALTALAPCGGYMLSDGANVCPGTPLSSFHAIMEAAEEYGLGP